MGGEWTGPLREGGMERYEVWEESVDEDKVIETYNHEESHDRNV